MIALRASGACFVLRPVPTSFSSVGTVPLSGSPLFHTLLPRYLRSLDYIFSISVRFQSGLELTRTSTSASLVAAVAPS